MIKVTIQNDRALPVHIAPGQQMYVSFPLGTNIIKGEDGYTPIKGVDYWTADDIEEITEKAKEAAVQAVFKEINVIDCGRAEWSDIE